MKKIIMALMFLLAVMLARGQEYLPLLEENRVWSVMHEKHTLMGDTIINEITYKKLFFHNYLEEFSPDSLKYIAALREDTLNKKVYFIWKDYNSEVLLYDFSLNVGEPFEAKSPEFYFYGPVYNENPINRRQLEVMMKIDSIVGGKNRKVLKLTRPYENHPIDYWIEGIGSIFGLLYAGFEMIPDGPYPFLLCLHKNELLVYQENDPYGYFVDTCYALPAVNIKELMYNTFKLTITPSFFQEKLTLESDELIQKIEVYDQTGRIVYRHYTLEPFTHLNISTGNWNSGLYIVRAGNTKGFVSKKILKQ